MRKELLVEIYTAEGKWKFGKVTQRLGKLHYRIRLDDGRSWTRHVNQMRPIRENTPIVENSQNDYFIGTYRKHAKLNKIIFLNWKRATTSG